MFRGLFFLICMLIISFFLEKMDAFQGVPFSAVTNAIFYLLCFSALVKKLVEDGAISHGGAPTFFFLAYFVYSLLISIYRGVPAQNLTYQAIVEIRPFVLYLAVINARSCDFPYKGLVNLSVVIIAGSIILEAFRLMSSGSYDAVFSAGGHTNNFQLYDGGAGLSRAVGVFWNPGQLSFFCIWVTGVFFIFYRKIPSYISKKRVKIIIILFIALLLASLRRADLLILVAALYLSYWLTAKKRIKDFVFLQAFIVTAVLFIFGISGYIDRALEHYRIFDPSKSVSPRIVYTWNALQIAKNEFPFGSGWGTFASHASAKYGSPLEEQMGLSSMWWYEADSASYDAFWAHVIAETGFLGLFVYAAFLLSLLAKQIVAKGDVLYKRLRVYVVLILIFSTMTSSILFSIYSISTIFLAFGFANMRALGNVGGSLKAI